MPDSPFPVLLRGSRYSCTLNRESVDFQSRMFEFGVSRAPSASAPVPCILVLTRAADSEINELSLTLAARDVRLARIDSDRSLDVLLTALDGDRRFELTGEPLEPRLVWLRHFDLEAIPRTGTAAEDSYARTQWHGFLSWVIARGDWRLVNRPVWELDRLTQLAGAREAGLTVPRSVVTTEPCRALDVLTGSRGGYMIKPIGDHWLEPEPGSLVGIFPQHVTQAQLGASGPEFAPILVQEFVESRYELRVFVVGDETASFRIEKRSAEDVWTDPASVGIRQCNPPEKLLTTLRRLAAGWALGVAAFDVLVTDDDYVFLEVNVNGDWQWFESRAACDPVSQSVIRYISKFFGG
jgi:hypothetical protein